MANVKMGFEGQMFIGTAGTTGATQVTNSKDITLNMDVERGNSTVRGDGSTVPIETEEVTVRKFSCEWTMIIDSTDTVLETLRAAAAAGTGIAMRLKDYSSGKGYDGDVTLSATHGKPLNGEQTVQFTAVPSRAYGRAPTLYV